jgi:predicted N-formylglutamate amidohydrolase
MTHASLEAFELHNAEAPAALLLFCDHASNAVPPEMNSLGLAATEFTRHIAYDIGAGALTRALSAKLSAPAVIARFSRLIVDLNRGPDDPTLVMKLSDGAIIPANRHLDANAIAERVARYYTPYHAEIAARIDAAMAESCATRTCGFPMRSSIVSRAKAISFPPKTSLIPARWRWTRFTAMAR